MKRPTGVTVSAILLLLGSLVLTLFAALMVFGRVMIPKIAHRGPNAVTMPQPGFLTAVIVVEALLVVAMAVWGFITFAGLLRMRPWARVSMLVIGGGQAYFCGVGALMMLLLVFVPLPSPVSHAQDPRAVVVVKTVFGVMALISALHAAVGGWWVVYFSLKKTTEAFRTGLTAAKSRRPLLISILAVLNLIGAASCLLASTLPFPAFLFSLILEGWRKALLYLSLAAIYAAIGLGLWRLREWARRLTLVLAGWGVLYLAYFLAVPSALEHLLHAGMKYSAAVGTLPATPPEVLGFQRTMVGFSFGLSILWCAAIVWVLMYFRAAFGPPSGAEPPQLEAPPLG